MTKYISNSQIGLYKHCKRRWYLAHYRALGIPEGRETVTGAMQLGTRIHEVLYRRYQFGEDAMYALKDVYDSAELLVLEQGREEEVLGLRKEHDLAHAMISGYEQWLSDEGADVGFEVVGAETAITAPIPGIDDVELRGKLDQRVVRKVDGARLFLDHKTTPDFVGAGRTMHMNPQFKFYHLLEKLDAYAKTGSAPPARTDGGLVNMLRKVKRTAKAIPPFYQRIEVRHNDTELQTFWRQVYQTIIEILELTAKLDEGVDPTSVAYPSPAPDCTWKCQFFSLCGLMDDGSDWNGFIDGMYVNVDPDARYLEVIQPKAE